jgi:hypothetical protein
MTPTRPATRNEQINEWSGRLATTAAALLQLKSTFDAAGRIEADQVDAVELLALSEDTLRLIQPLVDESALHPFSVLFYLVTGRFDWSVTMEAWLTGRLERPADWTDEQARQDLDELSAECPAEAARLAALFEAARLPAAGGAK